VEAYLIQHLLLAHCLLDYSLQGEFLATMKARYSLIMIVHCAIWSLGIALVMQLHGLYEPWMLWWLFLGHAGMDILKCHKLIPWLAAFIFLANDYKVSTEGVSPEEHEFYIARVHLQTARRQFPWVVDVLGLPLWIDQLWHVFQLWMILP
jgi:hypothetical protein